MNQVKGKELPAMSNMEYKIEGEKIFLRFTKNCKLIREIVVPNTGELTKSQLLTVSWRHKDMALQMHDHKFAIIDYPGSGKRQTKDGYQYMDFIIVIDNTQFKVSVKKKAHHKATKGEITEVFAPLFGQLKY